jgi:uncharacterized Zn finger protein
VDYDDFYEFRPYVSAGARRALAARELAQLRKNGRAISPVVIEGRKIVRTFWGEAWCDNLERYSDYANRLPRGRTYVRNGSVIDLQIRPGCVTALVSGSSRYDVKVTVAEVPRVRWGALCQDCSGAIDSLIELLQGRISKAVMTRLCDQKTGLFPAPKDIVFTCSCPDWASMCKHVAAVLYGIGARLDDQPELLFTLRQVDQQDLIARAGSDLTKSRKGLSGAKVLASDDLSEMFGIEMAPALPTPRAAAGTGGKTRSKTADSGASSSQTRAARPVKPKQPAPRRRGGRTLLTAAKQRAIGERMRKYWAAKRNLAKKKKASQS